MKTWTFSAACTSRPKPAALAPSMCACVSVSVCVAINLPYARSLLRLGGAPQADSDSSTNETVLKLAMEKGRAMGIMRPHDRVVIVQKLGDSFVVKIIEIPANA